MVQFNISQREITLKVVYYGPALSGKTTNLQAIHRLVQPECRGRLMTLDTQDDRTLFFDLLPIHFTSASGFKVKIKLFTVPGQVMHNSTRRIVLNGADAIAFIADSQVSQHRANSDSWRNMLENLKENVLRYEDMPIVIQFNKRDLPEIRTDEEIARVVRQSREPVYKAVAVRGEGVLETLHGLLDLSWGKLEDKYEIGRKFGLGREAFLKSVFTFMAPDAVSTMSGSGPRTMPGAAALASGGSVASQHAMPQPVGVNAPAGGGQAGGTNGHDDGPPKTMPGGPGAA